MFSPEGFIEPTTDNDYKRGLRRAIQVVEELLADTRKTERGVKIGFEQAILAIKKELI